MVFASTMVKDGTINAAARGDTDRRRVATQQYSIQRSITLPTGSYILALWVLLLLPVATGKSFHSHSGEGGGVGFTARTNNVKQQRCTDTQVQGLPSCPQLDSLMPILLENKRALLRLALDAVTGADAEDPLQLVHRMANNTVDGTYSHLYGWPLWDEGLPQGTRFVDWLETVYVERLHRRRPVLIFVHPDEVCSLRDALTIPSQTESASEAASPSSGQATVTFSAKESEPDDKQQPTLVLAPLALMTVGWDMGGSPLSRTDTVQCALDILELPQVVRWFVSHHTGHYPPGSKLEFVGIGFGGMATRSQLKQSVYISETRKRLEALTYCDDNHGGMLDLLFMCNNDAPNTPRPAINAALSTPGQEAAKVVPENRYPMEPAATVAASTEGFFAVSPGGTRPDCFRHYEYLLAGNIVYITDDPSLRIILANLPVVFVKGGSDGWINLTCDVMEHHAKSVARRLQQAFEPGSTAPPFEFEKLTLRYWDIFVRDRVWAAGAAYHAKNNVTDASATPNEVLDLDLELGPPS